MCTQKWLVFICGHSSKTRVDTCPLIRSDDDSENSGKIDGCETSPPPPNALEIAPMVAKIPSDASKHHPKFHAFTESHDLVAYICQGCQKQVDKANELVTANDNAATDRKKFIGRLKLTHDINGRRLIEVPGEARWQKASAAANDHVKIGLEYMVTKKMLGDGIRYNGRGPKRIADRTDTPTSLSQTPTTPSPAKPRVATRVAPSSVRTNPNSTESSRTATSSGPNRQQRRKSGLKAISQPATDDDLQHGLGFADESVPNETPNRRQLRASTIAQAGSGKKGKKRMISKEPLSEPTASLTPAAKPKSSWSKRRDQEKERREKAPAHNPELFTKDGALKKTRDSFKIEDELENRQWDGNSGRLGKLNAMYYRLNALPKDAISDESTSIPSRVLIIADDAGNQFGNSQVGEGNGELEALPLAKNSKKRKATSDPKKASTNKSISYSSKVSRANRKQGLKNASVRPSLILKIPLTQRMRRIVKIFSKPMFNPRTGTTGKRSSNSQNTFMSSAPWTPMEKPGATKRQYDSGYASFSSEFNQPHGAKRLRATLNASSLVPLSHRSEDLLATAKNKRKEGFWDVVSDAKGQEGVENTKAHRDTTGKPMAPYDDDILRVYAARIRTSELGRMRRSGTEQPSSASSLTERNGVQPPHNTPTSQSPQPAAQVLQAGLDARVQSTYQDTHGSQTRRQQPFRPYHSATQSQGPFHAMHLPRSSLAPAHYGYYPQQLGPAPYSTPAQYSLSYSGYQTPLYSLGDDYAINPYQSPYVSYEDYGQALSVGSSYSHDSFSENVHNYQPSSYDYYANTANSQAVPLRGHNELHDSFYGSWTTPINNQAGVAASSGTMDSREGSAGTSHASSNNASSMGRSNTGGSFRARIEALNSRRAPAYSRDSLDYIRANESGSSNNQPMQHSQNVMQAQTSGDFSTSQRQIYNQSANNCNDTTMADYAACGTQEQALAYQDTDGDTEMEDNGENIGESKDEGESSEEDLDGDLGPFPDYDDENVLSAAEIAFDRAFQPRQANAANGPAQARAAHEAMQASSHDGLAGSRWAQLQRAADEARAGSGRGDGGHQQGAGPYVNGPLNNGAQINAAALQGTTASGISALAQVGNAASTQYRQTMTALAQQHAMNALHTPISTPAQTRYERAAGPHDFAHTNGTASDSVMMQAGTVQASRVSHQAGAGTKQTGAAKPAPVQATAKPTRIIRLPMKQTGTPLAPGKKPRRTKPPRTIKPLYMDSSSGDESAESDADSSGDYVQKDE